MPEEVLIKTSGFTYAGIKVSALDRVLYTDDLGEQAYELSQKSGQLRDKVGLYILGRDAENNLNEEGISKLLQSGELTQEDIETAKALYRDCQSRFKGDLPWRGHVHSNLAIIEPNATIPGTRKPGEGYVAAHYFENTGGYDKNGKIIETGDTTEEMIWLPPSSSIVVPTRYGTNNRFGLPDETIPDTKENREIAKQKLKDAGLPESEFAKFYRADGGSVVVWSDSYGGNGALCVFLNYRPWDRSYMSGSFPASGLASGASHGNEKTIPKDEYKSLLKKARAFEKVSGIVETTNK